MKTDKAWKEAIEELFEDFLLLFLPELYEIVDFSKGYEFLDKEFNSLFPEAESDDKRVDKLIKVFLNDGNEQWVLVHTEVQSYHDKEFGKRMYQYYSRILDKYDKDIEALAIFTYKGNLNKSNKYQRGFLNTKLIYEYNIYDISVQDEKNLEKSDNPFSLIVLAALKAIGHKSNDDNNIEFKKSFFKLLLESGFNNSKLESIFRFLNFIFEINDLNKRKIFYQEVGDMALKANRFDVLTDYEEVAFEKGIEQGIEKGQIEGQKKEAKNLLLRLLNKKFKEMPEQIELEINNINDIKLIEKIVESVFELQSYEDVLMLINEKN